MNHHVGGEALRLVRWACLKRVFMTTAKRSGQPLASGVSHQSMDRPALPGKLAAQLGAEEAVGTGYKYTLAHLPAASSATRMPFAASVKLRPFAGSPFQLALSPA